MMIEHDQTATVDRELYDEVRDRVHRLESQVTAVRAVVNKGEPDYYRSIFAASQLLYALLRLPDERPGSWEAPHVAALWEPLCVILDALKAERPEHLKGEDGGRPVNVDRLVDLIIRSLTAENAIVDVHRSHTVYNDRVALSVVDTDGDRWRIHILREPWSAPA